MALSRTVVRVCHLVSAVVAVVVLTAGDTLYEAWGCYGTSRLGRLDLGCCGDDPALPWVAESGGVAAICRQLTDGCQAPPDRRTEWFGRSAALAAHLQVRIPTAFALCRAPCASLTPQLRCSGAL